MTIKKKVRKESAFKVGFFFCVLFMGQNISDTMYGGYRRCNCSDACGRALPC